MIPSIQVLDYNNVNVALRKAATSRSGYGASNGPELAVDGIIGDDLAEQSTFVSASCGTNLVGTALEVDLGALYWLVAVRCRRTEVLTWNTQTLL